MNKQEIRKQISEYRLFAWKNRGKNISKICFKEADRLEKNIREKK